MELPKWSKSVAEAISAVIITLASIKELLSGSQELPSGVTLNYLIYLAYVGLFAIPVWVLYQGILWSGKRRVDAQVQQYIAAIDRTKLDELEKNLTSLAAGRQQSDYFMTSGDPYLGKIPFRQRASTYNQAEIEMESLVPANHPLGVKHDDFYVNPDLLEATEANLAHITDLSSKLLLKVKEWKRISAVEEFKEQALQFRVISTTDWFEIGLEGGRLKDLASKKFSKGTIENLAPFDSYFHVNHRGSPKLEMRVEATFQYPRKKKVCVLRKGDIGQLDVEVRSGQIETFTLFGHRVFLFPFFPNRIGGWVYERSPRDKNEVLFELD